MKSLLFTTIIALIISGQIACSSNAANVAVETNNNTVANTVAESLFASITDANAALAEGDRLLDENQTEQGIEAYKRAVELNPEFGEAFFKMGIAYALLEKEARQSGEAEILPGETSANKKPVKTDSDKMFERAVAAYKKQIAASPKDSAAYFNLGRAYNKLNKDEEAEEALSEAVDLKPDDSEYQTELGAIRIKLAQFHEALGPLKKAIALDPDNSRAVDLLDDAQAGAKRVDYVSKPNDNKFSNSSNTISNRSSNTNTNSNTSTKPPETIEKPANKENKDKKPEPGPTRPKSNGPA